MRWLGRIVGAAVLPLVTGALLGRAQEWCAHGPEYVILRGPGGQRQLVPAG